MTRALSFWGPSGIPLPSFTSQGEGHERCPIPFPLINYPSPGFLRYYFLKSIFVPQTGLALKGNVIGGLAVKWRGDTGPTPGLPGILALPYPCGTSPESQGMAGRAHDNVCACESKLGLSSPAWSIKNASFHLIAPKLLLDLHTLLSLAEKT